MRPSAFICYRRPSFWAARAIKEEFVAKGWQVFLDQHDLQLDWNTEISVRLKRADIVLAVIAPDWSDGFTTRDGEGARDVVLKELRTALENATPIAPILLDGAEEPKKESLPEDLVKLANYEFRRLSSAHVGDGLRKLERACRASIGRHTPAVGIRRTIGVWMARWPQLAALVAVAGISVLLTAWALKPEDGPSQLVVVEDVARTLIGSVKARCKVVTWDNYQGPSGNEDVDWNIEKDLRDVPEPEPGEERNSSVERVLRVLQEHENRPERDTERFLDVAWRKRGFTALRKLSDLVAGIDATPGERPVGSAAPPRYPEAALAEIRDAGRAIREEYREHFRLFPRDGQLSFAILTLDGVTDVTLLPNHEEESAKNFLAMLGSGEPFAVEPRSGRHDVCMFRGDAVEFACDGRRWRLVVTSIANPGKKWRVPSDDMVGVRLARLE